MSRNVNKPTAYDYVLGLLLVLQDMKEKTNELEETANKLSNNFSVFEGARNINVSNLYTQLSAIVDDYHLVDLHIGFAERRITSILEVLKENQDEVTSE